MNNSDAEDRTLILDIESLGYGGVGISRKNNKVHFVYGVLPGEKVRVQIKKEREKFNECQLIEIIENNPSRKTPGCSLAFSLHNNKHYCPGCRYQHSDYQYEVKLKNEQFKELLDRIGKLGNLNIQPPVPSPQPLAYRNKIVLHFSLDKDRQPILGYFTEDNKSIINIDKCPLACEKINSELYKLKNQNKWYFHFEIEEKIIFRYTEENGVLIWSNKDEKNELLIEKTEWGNFFVPKKSFYQVNLFLNNRLIKEVHKILLENPTKYLIDLYAGIGIFGLTAAKIFSFNKIFISDMDKEAMYAARTNYENFNLNTQIKFLEAHAGKAFNKISSQINVSQATMIVDPPRKGLDKKLIDSISKNSPFSIIYISCGPDTLARDLNKLTKMGYKINFTKMIDMFPRTAHFETITHLKRSSNP